MKPIKFSQHAREQMLERGASEDEVRRRFELAKGCLPSMVAAGIGRTFSMIAHGVDELTRLNRFFLSLPRRRMNWLL